MKKVVTKEKLVVVVVSTVRNVWNTVDEKAEQQNTIKLNYF